MPGKKNSSLRTYHLLVVRQSGGFEWQIRYDHFANPLQRSEASFATATEASAAGEAALAALKRAADDQTA